MTCFCACNNKYHTWKTKTNIIVTIVFIVLYETFAQIKNNFSARFHNVINIKLKIGDTHEHSYKCMTNAVWSLTIFLSQKQYNEASALVFFIIIEHPIWKFLKCGQVWGSCSLESRLRYINEFHLFLPSRLMTLSSKMGRW